MSDLTRLTISEARAKLRGKEIKASEITDAYLAAIEQAVMAATQHKRSHDNFTALSVWTADAAAGTNSTHQEA